MAYRFWILVLGPFGSPRAHDYTPHTHGAAAPYLLSVWLLPLVPAPAAACFYSTAVPSLQQSVQGLQVCQVG